MTWEEALRSPRLRRWRWPAVGVAAVLLVGIAIVLSQQEPSGTLAIGPTVAPEPEDQDETLPAIDPANFVPERLHPLETTSRQAANGPLLPDAPEVTVVTTDEQELRAIDIATGDIITRRVAATAPTFGIDPWTLFMAGGRAISNDGNNVVQLHDGLERTRIARRHHALHTADDASVWVLNNRMPRSAMTALRLRFDGTVVDRVDLPPVAVPHIGTADGVLVSSPGGIHIASGNGIRQITESGQFITASTDRLAWLDCAADLSCEIVAGTFDDPDQLRLPVDRAEMPGYHGPVVLGFSQDGRWLALPMFRVAASGIVVEAAVVIIDTAAGAVVDRIEARGSAGYQGIPLAWSPDGRWLFLALNGGVNAWNADTGELTELELDNRFRRAAGLTVVEH